MANLPAGIGYIIIPKETDRQLYIDDCFRTHKITFWAGYGQQIFSNVLVDEDTIQKVIFPEDETSYGSPIVWLSIPTQAQPVVIACLKFQNDYYLLEEQSKRITKTFEDTSIDVNIKAQKGTFDVNIVGGLKTAKMNLNVINDNEDSEINIFVKGKAKIHSTKGTTIISDNFCEIKVIDENNKNLGIIRYEKAKGLSYSDEFGNEYELNKDHIRFKPNIVFEIGASGEWMLKGETTQTELLNTQNFLTTLKQMLAVPVTEPGNGAPSAFQIALNSALSSLSVGDFNQVLSKLSKTE